MNHFGNELFKRPVTDLSRRFYQKEELTQAERNQIGVGNIRLNRIQCKRCKDIITSHHRHDYNECFCGSVQVDGGSWYLRRGWSEGNSEDLIIEMSEYYKDIKDIRNSEI